MDKIRYIGVIANSLVIGTFALGIGAILLVLALYYTILGCISGALGGLIAK
jgi:hypothetical protein